MDLAQVQKLANRKACKLQFGDKILMVVDLFSRFVLVGTVRNKTVETTKACFIKLCSEKNDLKFLKKLWIDDGKAL